MSAAESLGYGIDSSEAAYSLGVLSGFTTGAGETAAMVRALLSDPLGYLASMTKILAVVEHLDQIGTLVGAMADGFERQMKTANPYDIDEQRQLYEHFRTTYYLGMIGFEVTLALAGSVVASAAKNSERLLDLADTLDKTRVARLARYIYKGYRHGTAPVRKVEGAIAASLSKGVALSLKGASRVIDSTIVGKTLHKKYLIRQMDVDVEENSPIRERATGE